MSEKQPLINRKMQIRLAVGLFVIAGLFVGRSVVINFLQDPDTGTVQSTGWIAAIEDTDNGTQAVIIKPDGTVVKSPDYKPGFQDQQVVWQPDGNRLFFSSNRSGEDQGFHIYRWNPAHDLVQNRSTGSRSQSNPTFPNLELTEGPQELLTISSGLVVTLDPRTGVTHQMLPFIGRNPTTVAESEGGGIGSQFGPEYDNLGHSFRIAKWTLNKAFIAGVLEKDAGGESLVVQNMNPQSPQEAGPEPIATGDHIDFSISPKDGKVVFSVQNWQWPDPTRAPKSYVKGNKITTPYQHMIGYVLPGSKDAGVIIASKSDKICFGQPTVSPDGTKIAVSVGQYVNDGLSSIGIIVCPLANNGGASPALIFRGPGYNPHWSPDGNKIVFVEQNPGTHSDICVMNSDGSDFKDLTNGSGDFDDPSFSPQTGETKSP